MGGVGTGLWMWARADWRRRRIALLALSLLLSIAGGVVLTAVSGARRTASSLERLSRAAHAGDLLANVGDYDPAAVDAIRALPSTSRVGAATIVFAIVDGNDSDLGLVVPRDGGIGSELELGLLVEGSRPDPTHADEVLLNETTARMLDKQPGDRVVVHTLTPEQVAAERYFPPEGPDLPLTVVGVVREVADAVSTEEGTLYGTPALHAQIEGRVDEFATYMGVALEEGADLERAQREIYEIFGDRRVDVFASEVRSRPARKAVSASAAGLAAFAAAAAIATLVVLGQAVSRHVSGAAADVTTLRSLGATSAQCLLAVAATALPILVAGSLGTLVVAAAGSTTMPVGLAGRVDPSAGFDLDLTVLVLGGAASVALVAGAALTGSWRARAGATVRTRPVSVVTRLGRAGGSPALLSGVGLALDRNGPGRLRSAVGAAIFAVAGLLGALVFGASLDALLREPDRWGHGWDASFNFTSDTVEDAALELSRDDDIAALARFDSGATLVGAESVRTHGLRPVRGLVEYSIREGRSPERPGEVVVGPATADRLDIEVGGFVAVRHPDSRQDPTPLAVVGVALFPEIDDGDFTDGIGMVGEDFDRHASIPAAFEASQVVARVADGVEVASVVERVGREFEDSTVDAIVRPPRDIETMENVEYVPRLLLPFMGLLGLASLLHALRTAIARRPTDLAMLSALGMTRRQVGWCCVTAGATILAIAVGVGAPLGTFGGRRAWAAAAHSLEVAAEPRVPLLAAIAVLAAAVAVTIAVALPSSRRVHPAQLTRNTRA